jgi:hypothetical protein
MKRHILSAGDGVQSLVKTRRAQPPISLGDGVKRKRLHAASMWVKRNFGLSSWPMKCGDGINRLKIAGECLISWYRMKYLNA